MAAYGLAGVAGLLTTPRSRLAVCVSCWQDAAVGSPRLIFQTIRQRFASPAIQRVAGRRPQMRSCTKLAQLAQRKPPETQRKNPHSDPNVLTPEVRTQLRHTPPLPHCRTLSIRRASMSVRAPRAPASQLPASSAQTYMQHARNTQKRCLPTFLGGYLFFCPGHQPCTAVSYAAGRGIWTLVCSVHRCGVGPGHPGKPGKLDRGTEARRSEDGGIGNTRYDPVRGAGTRGPWVGAAPFFFLLRLV